MNLARATRYRFKCPDAATPAHSLSRALDGGKGNEGGVKAAIV